MAVENNQTVLFLPILLYGHVGSVSVRWMPENFCSYFMTILSSRQIQTLWGWRLK